MVRSGAVLDQGNRGPRTHVRGSGLDRPGVPGLHEHPGWSGGVASSVPLREGDVMVVVCGLVELIATAGLATDAPDEGKWAGPPRPGPVAAHEWEPCSGCSPPLGPWSSSCRRPVRVRPESGIGGGVGGQGDQTTGRGGSGHRERAHGAGTRRGRAGGVPAAVRADGGQSGKGGGGSVGRDTGGHGVGGGDGADRAGVVAGGGVVDRDKRHGLIELFGTLQGVLTTRSTTPTCGNASAVCLESVHTYWLAA